METKHFVVGALILALVITSGALVYIYTEYLIPNPSPRDINLNTFNSYDELKSFLIENKDTKYYSNYYGETASITTFARSESVAADGASGKSSSDFSSTNIQVEGVDEADIVKNDGKYIYLVTGNKITIIDAFPGEDANKISEIEFEEGNNIQELFLNDDKLIIFGNKNVKTDDKEAASRTSPERYPGPRYKSYSFTNIYDISDKENPELESEILNEGSYQDSRMIGDYVYTITTQYIDYINEEPILPIVINDGAEKTLAVSDIYYTGLPAPYSLYTNVQSININSGDTETKSFLTGYASNLYVSQNNIYLVEQKYVPSDVLYEEVIELYIKVIPEISDDIKEIQDSDKKSYEKQREIEKLINDHINKLSDEERKSISKELEEEYAEYQKEVAKLTERTIIHKISVDKSDIEYEASGEVPGRTLNQFSIDEYKGNLRIATTSGQVSRSQEGSSLNHVYILNEDLFIIGSVEDLAQGERIYSARFLGERGYLVTFQKVDPLFVLDLSNPENPKVLGELKIPGYSDYLHPYDENHIIGIGKEAIEAEEGNFAWYQGVKLALFDVSDPSHPIEIDSIAIGDRGTESLALHEHKAFLFNKDKNLLVLPIMLAKINTDKYSGEIPTNAYGEPKQAGAIVYDISLDGIKERAVISHADSENTENEYRYSLYNSQVKRSLYIDNYLYTISNNLIKINDLDTINLDEIKELELESEEPVYYID